MQEKSTISFWLKNAAKSMKDAGIPSARLDAELILANTLRKNRTYLHAHLDEEIDPRRIVSRTLWEVCLSRQKEAKLSSTNGVRRCLLHHVVTMELTGVLLIIAAVGALTLTHRREIGRASCREECRSRWSPYH